MGVYVTAQGLQIPTVEQLIGKMKADQLGTIDPLLNTDPDSPFGLMNGIVASPLREAWEALEVAYNGNNPDASEGFLLETVAAITGTTKAAAQPSRFRGSRRLTANLNAGTTVPIGTVFAVLGNDAVQFATTEIITNPGGGAADVLVSAACTVTGPVSCNAGTLTVIKTPVVGLNSINNTADAEPGTFEDNPTQLRLRREQELRATGSGTIDSIKADLLAYEDETKAKPILDVKMNENTSDNTDGNGLPPHSFEALVYDGVTPSVADNVIAQLIWDSKPGGIPSYGITSGTALDRTGVAKTVPFSRPSVALIKFRATLALLDPNQVPAQYEDAVKAAIIARFAIRVKPESLIRCNHYEAASIAIAGIDDCVIEIGFDGFAFGAPDVNLQLAARQMGNVMTTSITVQ